MLRLLCRVGRHDPGADQLWVRRADGWPEAIARRCVRCDRVFITLEDVMAASRGWKP